MSCKDGAFFMNVKCSVSKCSFLPSRSAWVDWTGIAGVKLVGESLLIDLSFSLAWVGVIGWEM